VNKVQTLSDHKEASFGLNYGLLIKAVRLLALAVFVINQEKLLKYLQIVPELSGEPNYSAVLETAKNLKEAASGG